MSYRINKTNGDLLVDLVDGIIDTSSSDITLVGKNYKGFGEAFNENFVALLENFASSSAPSNPLKGQIWYDLGDNRLKLYDGTEFRTAGGPIVSSTQPNNLVTGDLWIDNNQNKLYMWDGTDLTLVGPTFTAGQGKTGYEAVTMVDTGNQSRTILALYIGGVLAGIQSRQEFTPSSSYALAPYAVGRVIKIGFNPVVVADYKFNGIATSAESLADNQGNTYSNTDFVSTNERDVSNVVVPQSMLGALFVKGTNGVKVGVGDTEYAHFKTLTGDTTSVIETQQNNFDLALRVKQGSDYVNAVKIDTSASSVGIFNNSPSYNLDVTGTGRYTGDLTVDGSLLVKGDTSYFNVATMRVEDPNIELGLLDDSTEGDDTNADGGGITLRSSNGSKDISWVQSTGNWTFNQNVDLGIGKEYRIENVQVLSKTKLGDTVTQANGITSIGTLASLTVTNDINLSGNIVNAGPMSITTGGTITLNNAKVTGLATPAAASDAVTKAYSDNIVATIPTSFSLDITAFADPNAAGAGNGPINDVKNVLDDISPVGVVNNGATAKIHCVSYANSTVTGIAVSITTDPDTSGTLTKSTIAVDSASTQNETVVQDIVAANATSGTFTPSPNRYTMTFEVQAGVWAHTNTSNYS